LTRGHGRTESWLSDTWRNLSLAKVKHTLPADQLTVLPALLYWKKWWILSVRKARKIVQHARILSKIVAGSFTRSWI
jgi:hypothetical protein